MLPIPLHSCQSPCIAARRKAEDNCCIHCGSLRAKGNSTTPSTASSGLIRKGTSKSFLLVQKRESSKLSLGIEHLTLVEYSGFFSPCINLLPFTNSGRANVRRCRETGTFAHSWQNVKWFNNWQLVFFFKKIKKGKQASSVGQV